MAEMTAIEFLKEKTRMTNSCNIMCADCKLADINNGMKVNCKDLQNFYPEATVSIVQKWSKENPVKTIMDDFFEKFPTPQLTSKCKPRICPKSLGYKNEFKCYNIDCFDSCWDEPLEVD